MFGIQWTCVNISEEREGIKQEGSREGMAVKRKREKDYLTFSFTLKRDQNKIQVKKKYT